MGIADVFEGDSEDIVSMTSSVLGEGHIVDIRENKQRHLGESAIAASLVQSSRENRNGEEQPANCQGCRRRKEHEDSGRLLPVIRCYTAAEEGS